MTTRERTQRDRNAKPNCPGKERGPIGVMLLVSGLDRGGAERQAVQLANNLDPKRFSVMVCSLSEHVPLAVDLIDRNEQLHIVKKRWRYDFSTIWRVARLMRKLRIEVVQSFLFDADIVARLAGKLAGVSVIIGSERNTDYRRPKVQALCLRLTRSLCDMVVANSDAGKRFTMQTQGLPGHRVNVIRNGVDVNKFKPGSGAALRREIGVRPEQPLIGMVASFKPQKNHMMFLQVARRVLQDCPDAMFLSVGDKLQSSKKSTITLRAGAGFHGDTEGYHLRVMEAIEELGIRKQMVFIQDCNDMASVYNACDVTVLTSLHEGTPNVVLESMACAVPVVVTDVADNASLVPDGEVGFVVQVDDVEHMAVRVLGLLADRGLQTRVGNAARDWVTQRFSLDQSAQCASAVYCDVIASKHRRILSRTP